MWVGRVRGGVAMATVLAGAGFAAISGSSTAAAATLASTSIPSMVKQGYEPKLAGGVVAISGTLAMIIPPSIALIRSEEHTSELQSRGHLVCRLLLAHHKSN